MHVSLSRTFAVHGYQEQTLQCAYLPVQVAAHSLDTGIRGGYYNVCINLKSVKDEEYVSSVSSQVEELLQASAANLEKVLETAKNRK